MEGIVWVDLGGFSPEVSDTLGKDNGWPSASFVAPLGPGGVQDKGPCPRSKLKKKKKKQARGETTSPVRLPLLGAGPKSQKS